MQLRGVFNRIAQTNLKLKPSKCKLFKTQIAYLGHIVSKYGEETDPKKVGTITIWPQPTIVPDVQSFLMFTNHYRRFICNYAQIARPINLITAGDKTTKEKQWNGVKIVKNPSKS